MAILIIGGAGYIGSHVNKLFSNSGYKTIVFDNLSRGHKALVKWGVFIKGDISNRQLLSSIIRDYDIDCVIHLAAYAYPEESAKYPKLYYENNVLNSIKLMKTLVDNGINKVIFSSSCATFGNATYSPIDEKHPQLPINPYGNTKLIIEKLIMDFSRAYGIQYGILRYFNVIGADPEGEIGEIHNPEPHIIPNLLNCIIQKNKKFTIYGSDYSTSDGTCVRDYIDVNDIAMAHKLTLNWFKDNTKENIDCNLGTEKGYSIKEIIKIVESITGKTIDKQYQKRRIGDPPFLVSSNKKALKMLNWKPSVPIIDSIQNAFAWQKYLIEKKYDKKN